MGRRKVRCLDDDKEGNEIYHTGKCMRNIYPFLILKIYLGIFYIKNSRVRRQPSRREVQSISIQAGKYKG